MDAEIDTGGAMPPPGHLRHASSEELLGMIVQGIDILAERNGVPRSEILGILERDARQDEE